MRVDEDGELKDCVGFDECKKYHEADKEIGMCEGCDHYYSTGMH